MDDSVVVAAEQREIRQFGVAAGYPVSDVIGMAHHRWPVAAGEGEVSVTQHEGGPDRVGDEPPDRGHRQVGAEPGEPGETGETGNRGLGQPWIPRGRGCAV